MSTSRGGARTRRGGGGRVSTNPFDDDDDDEVVLDDDDLVGVTDQPPPSYYQTTSRASGSSPARAMTGGTNRSSPTRGGIRTIPPPPPPRSGGLGVGLGGSGLSPPRGGGATNAATGGPTATSRRTRVSTNPFDDSAMMSSGTTGTYNANVGGSSVPGTTDHASPLLGGTSSRYNAATSTGVASSSAVPFSTTQLSPRAGRSQFPSSSTTTTSYPFPSGRGGGSSSTMRDPSASIGGAGRGALGQQHEQQQTQMMISKPPLFTISRVSPTTTATTGGGTSGWSTSSTSTYFMLPQTLKHTVYAKLWLLSHHLHGTGYVNLNNPTATTQSSSLTSSGITTTSGGNSSASSSIFSSTIFSDPPTTKTSASTSTPSCPFYALKDSSEAVSLKYLGITEYDQISGTTTTITTSTTVRQHPSAQSRGGGAPSATAAAAAAAASSSSSSSYSVTGLFKNLLPVGVGGGSAGGGGGTGSSSTGGSDGSGGAFSSSALEKLSSLVHFDDVTLDGMLTDRSIKQVYEPNVHCVACGNGWMVSVMECEPILHHSTTSSDTITTTTAASAISSSRLSSSAPSSSSNKSNNLSSLLHSWHQPQQQQQYDGHPSKYPSTSTSKRHLRGSSVLRLVSRWNVRHHQQQQQQQGDEGGGVVRSSIAAAAAIGSSSTSSLEMVSSLIVLPTPIVTDASEASLLVHSPTIHGVFVDPTGHHTLVSATNGELYHIHSSSHIARRLKGFGPLFRPKTFQTTTSPLSDDKGTSTTTGAALSSPSKRSGKGSSGTTFVHPQDGKKQEKTKQRSSTKVSMNFQRGEFVTCVAWDAPSNITDQNSKRMLLGTNRGRIYEYQIRLTTKTKGGVGKHTKAKTSSSAPTSRRSSVEDGFTGGTLPPIIPSSKTSTNPFENDDEDDDDDDDDDEEDTYDDRVLLFEEIKAAGKQKGSSSSAAAAATTSFSSLARMKQQGGPLLLMDMNTFIMASSSSKKGSEEEKATTAMDSGSSTTMIKVSGLHFERLSGGRIMVVVLTNDNSSNTIASPVTRYISSSSAVASTTSTNTMLHTFCSAPNNPTLRGAFDLDAPLSQHSSIDLSPSSSSSSSSATTTKGGGGLVPLMRDEGLRLCRTQGVLLGALLDHTTTTGSGTNSSTSAGANTFFAFDAGPSLGIYCGVLDTKYVTSSVGGNLGGQPQQRMLKETALIPYPRKRMDDRTVGKNDNNVDETIMATTTATQLCSLAVTPHHVITVNKKGMVHFIDRVSRQIVQTEHLPSSFLMFGSGGGGPASSGSSVGVRGHNHHHLHGSMEFCMDIRHPNQIWLRHGRNFMLLSTNGSINEDRDIWKSRIEHGLLMGAPMAAAAAATTSKSSSNYYTHANNGLASSATTSYNMIQKILAEFDMAKTSLGSSSISDDTTSRDDLENEKRWKRMLIDYVRGEYLLRAAAAAGASSSSVIRGGEVATATTGTSPTDLVEEAASYLSEAPSLLCPFDKTSLRLGLPSTLLSVGQNDPMLNRISYFDGYERIITNENENSSGTDEDHRRRPYYYEEDPVLMEHALQSYITEKLCRGISDRDSVACAMLSAWLVELQLLSSSSYGNSNDHHPQGLVSSRREGRNNRTSCFYPEEENILLDAYSTGADGHYRDRYLVGNKHSHDGDDDDANNEQRSSMMLESFLSSLNITQQQQQQQQATEQNNGENENDENDDMTGMFNATMEHGTNNNIIGVDDCQTTIKILQSYDVKASVCAPYASEAALSKGLLAATGGTNSSSSRRTRNSGGMRALEEEDHHQGGITGGNGMITVGRGDLKSAIDAALHARPGKDGAKDALRLLERTPIERGEPFYYKYAYQLLCRAPQETCQSLLKQYNKKQPQTKINASSTAAFTSESSVIVVGLPQPTKLLPSLMAYDNRRRLRKKQQNQKADRERRNKWRNKKGSRSTNITDDDDDDMMDDYLLYGDDGFVVEEGGSQSIIEYLEGVLQAGCPSAAISNYLVSLYAESRDEEPLFEFLRREQQTDLVAMRQQKQQQQQQQQSRGNKNEAASAALSSSSSLTLGLGSGCRLDRSYALRRILKTGRHFRSAVKLFMDFGLRPQAVELALKVDPALARELAKDTPSSIMSKEERKRLWLMIVQNAAADTTAAAASSSLSSYNYSTSLSKSSTGGGGGSGGASDSNISESKTSDSNLSTSKKDLELKTGKEVVAKVVAVLKECGPDILSIEDALPFLPDFAQIDEIKDEICNSLTSYSSKIDDYMQEIKESQESCNKLREEIHRLETYQMHVNPRATCALSHRRILSPSSPTPSSAGGGSSSNNKDDVLSRLEPFYVFPSGYVCLEGPLKKEVLPRLSMKQRQRVDVIEQELTKVRSKVESGQIPVLPASMKEHVNKLQAELNGLIAAECPLTGSGMVDSLDAPFTNEQSDKAASDQPRPFQSFFF